MVIFLHIVLYDEKFFNSVISQFEGDKRFCNQCLIYVPSGSKTKININLKYKIVRNEKQLLKEVSLVKYDFVFFHSLHSIFIKVMDYIPKTKKVIWWAWGYDLYSTEGRMPPFLPVELYKPHTCKLLNERINKAIVDFKRLWLFICHYLYKNKLKKIINRIDYFQPVTKYEYTLICMTYPTMSAKEFYYPNSFAENLSDHYIHSCEGTGIILGNSATYTNNHIDVWNNIHQYIQKDQKVYIPLSYGSKDYATKVMERIVSNNVVFLDTFLKNEQYEALFDKCSYFIVGCIRQQAMGNISICIARGIKIFAYRDSIIYKALESYGCYVFAIEDVDNMSFSTPLTRDEVNHNIMCYKAEKIRRKEILDQFFDEMPLV